MKTITPTQDAFGKFYEDSLFIDEKCMILPRGLPFPPDFIPLLSKWGFKSLLSNSDSQPKDLLISNDNNSPDASLNNIDFLHRKSISVKKVEESYHKLLEFTNKLHITMTSGKPIINNYLDQIIRVTIDSLKEYQGYFFLFQTFKSDKVYAVTHCVNTCLLSLYIGIKMKMSIPKLMNLGISALIHEIGNYKLPKSYRESEKKFTPLEKKIFQTHCKFGLDIGKQYRLNQDILDGIFCHHERDDGSGYPEGLKKNEIAPVAKIIAVACSYTAMISKRPFRKRILEHESMADLVHSMDTYDRSVVKTLIQILSFYPIGSYVQLSNETVARVISTNSDDPLYPRVEIITDNSGKKLEIPYISMTNNDLKIKRSLNHAEIEALALDDY